MEIYRDDELRVKLNLYRDTEHRGGKQGQAPDKLYVLDMQRKQVRERRGGRGVDGQGTGADCGMAKRAR